MPTGSAMRRQAQRSIQELDTAINVIVKAPVLRDAAELGLIAIDVVTLGELAAARVLTSTVVKQMVLSRTGREVSDEVAARVANNFYRDGSPVSFGSSSVVTNPNEAVFWSGRTDGIGGIDVAKLAAERYGGTTLEQLLERRMITMPAYDPLDPSSVQAWKEVSRQLASNASGEVHAVIGTQTREKSIWQEIEFPALQENPAVTKIYRVDPKTGERSLLFER